MSTMGDDQYREERNLLLFEYLLGTEHPHTVFMISPTVLK